MCTVFHCTVTVCVVAADNVTGTCSVFVPLLPSTIVAAPGRIRGRLSTVYAPAREPLRLVDSRTVTLHTVPAGKGGTTTRSCEGETNVVVPSTSPLPQL